MLPQTIIERQEETREGRDAGTRWRGERNLWSDSRSFISASPCPRVSASSSPASLLLSVLRVLRLKPPRNLSSLADALALAS